MFPSRRISEIPSVRLNSASWESGIRSPLGALTVTLRRPAIGSPSCGESRTARLNRRSFSKISVTTRPFVAASIASWTSCTLIPWRAVAALSTTIWSSGWPIR